MYIPDRCNFYTFLTQSATLLQAPQDRVHSNLGTVAEDSDDCLTDKTS